MNAEKAGGGGAIPRVGEARVEEEVQGPLPELMQGDLDDGHRDRYFADLAACAQILEVGVRRAVREQVPAGGGMGLDAARELLCRGEASGMQVRYRYVGEEWLDTLLARGGGWRLVRMRVGR
jgi:hypothetical protein